jgi:hypothetical protein
MDTPLADMHTEYERMRKMKVDLYTKTVLTVIAMCLLYFVAKDVPFAQNVQAQGMPFSAIEPQPMDEARRIKAIYDEVVIKPEINLPGARRYDTRMREEVREICEKTRDIYNVIVLHRSIPANL